MATGQRACRPPASAAGDGNARGRRDLCRGRARGDLRRWEKLREWMAAEREFLVWRSELEADRRGWVQAPERSRNDALLMGLALAHAQSWLARRAEDLPHADREFIDLSIRREVLEREQRE